MRGGGVGGEGGGGGGDGGGLGLEACNKNFLSTAVAVGAVRGRRGAVRAVGVEACKNFYLQQ